MMGFVTGVAAVSSARRAPSAVCTRSSFAGAAVVAAPVARATVRMSNIQESIQTEIAKAKEASEKYGKTSKEAAAAWYVLLERSPGSLHTPALCRPFFSCESPGVGVCVFVFGRCFHCQARLLTFTRFFSCARVEDRCHRVGCYVVDCAFLVWLLLRHRDAVEELEAEASHQKNAEKKDPLEEYCEDVPEADECRTYED